jgi:hypothetical protein
MHVLAAMVGLYYVLLISNCHFGSPKDVIKEQMTNDATKVAIPRQHFFIIIFNDVELVQRMVIRKIFLHNICTIQDTWFGTHVSETYNAREIQALKKPLILLRKQYPGNSNS